MNGRQLVLHHAHIRSPATLESASTTPSELQSTQFFCKVNGAKALAARGHSGQLRDFSSC